MASTLNEHLLTRLEATRKSLMAGYEGGSTVPSAMKGRERETFVENYLEKIFPPLYRFGSGAITDLTGACSGQIDVVIEFPFYPSFPMPNGSERLYLAESVAVALEVKSNLSAQWSEVERSVQQISPLRRKWDHSLQVSGRGLTSFHSKVSKIPFIAIGFKGFMSSSSLEQKINETPIEARPDTALVIESGAFVGYGSRASGPIGLFGLAIVLTGLVQQVTNVDFNLAKYVTSEG